MLALACEESLRCHSANPCQANRQTWCQPSQFIIPALLLNISTAADWSASWRQPKCVPVWYINYLTHCQLWYKTQTKKQNYDRMIKPTVAGTKYSALTLPGIKGVWAMLCFLGLLLFPALSCSDSWSSLCVLGTICKHSYFWVYVFQVHHLTNYTNQRLFHFVISTNVTFLPTWKQLATSNCRQHGRMICLLTMVTHDMVYSTSIKHTVLFNWYRMTPNTRMVAGSSMEWW